jgi:hypothetical protein
MKASEGERHRHPYAYFHLHMSTALQNRLFSRKNPGTAINPRYGPPVGRGMVQSPDRMVSITPGLPLWMSIGTIQIFAFDLVCKTSSRNSEQTFSV